MVSKVSRRSERVTKTCKFAISTRDYNFGSDGLEVGNRFIESEDFCWANDWGVSSLSRGVEVKWSGGGGLSRRDR
jgi:hypothetical protein